MEYTRAIIWVNSIHIPVIFVVFREWAALRVVWMMVSILFIDCDRIVIESDLFY